MKNEFVVLPFDEVQKNFKQEDIANKCISIGENEVKDWNFGCGSIFVPKDMLTETDFMPEKKIHELYPSFFDLVDACIEKKFKKDAPSNKQQIGFFITYFFGIILALSFEETETDPIKKVYFNVLADKLNVSLFDAIIGDFINDITLNKKINCNCNLCSFKSGIKKRPELLQFINNMEHLLDKE